MINRACFRNVIFISACGFAIFNWVAWNHAERMTHFVDEGERTKSPEELSLVEKIPLLIFGITVPRPSNSQTPTDFQLEYETVQIESTQHLLEGWLIQPPTQPKGTVILFHGYAESKDSLLKEAAELYEMGYTALLVDFRGSGGSSGQETSVGYGEAEDVTAAFDFVASDPVKFERPILLYGMSMGGAAVLRASATQAIDPDGLIIEAVFDEMVSTVENRFSSMGIPPFPAAQTLVFWGGVQAGFNGFEHNPADYAAQIDVPVLMLHGRNDPRATLAQGEALFANLPSEQKDMVVFAEAGHESSLLVEPDKWRASVSRFLNELN